MMINCEPAAIQPTEYYDQEDDVYYVSFGTGEPSHVMELDEDDDVLMEVGMFSCMLTGFRVLNFKKTKLDDPTKLIAKINTIVEAEQAKYVQRARVRSSQVQESFEKVFA
jgi:hypothetical protein